jgi:hypothetical protein
MANDTFSFDNLDALSLKELEKQREDGLRDFDGKQEEEMFNSDSQEMKVVWLQKITTLIEKKKEQIETSSEGC